ncbi:NIPSNAP family protein [Actinomadura sp. 3N407]|uniref:NIPSNAP family protein n=1 Tax=Actinomadura sp. 3N407 TaxID=3457423 RepID=UPI003FCCA425
MIGERHSTMDDTWPVVELRQYTLRPGAREVLIELFDREFVETQEAVGMRIIGQFRDEDNPDRFVWLRGFRDMTSRGEALTAFYLQGDAWKAHGGTASATMLDSTNALLLRPVAQAAGFGLPDRRPQAGATALPPSRFMATIWHLDAPVDDTFVRFFDERVRPVLTGTGAHPVARFETEPSENTFPRLPVREGENVFVWFAAFEDGDRRRAHLDRLARSAAWNEEVLPELSARLSRPTQRLNLAPTARSLLR